MIDWFTVAAQIVNFLILVALLKYFLYGRIVDAMERREQSIAERWNNAEEREIELQNELETSKRKSLELERQRANLMEAVRGEVETFREELTSKARKEAELAKSLWAESLHNETEEFLKDLRKRSTEQILVIVRKVLSDLADCQLEERIVHSFLEQVDRLGEAERKIISDSFEGHGYQAVVQTGFEHPGEQQDQMASKLRESFGEKLDVRFEQSSDLICGIAVQTNSHKVAWELNDYLCNLEEEICQALEEETTVTLSSRSEKQTAL